MGYVYLVNNSIPCSSTTTILSTVNKTFLSFLSNLTRQFNPIDLYQINPLDTNELVILPDIVSFVQKNTEAPKTTTPHSSQASIPPASVQQAKEETKDQPEGR